MSDNVNDFLEHYGKKGMKWGVRKERKSWLKTAKSAETATKVFNDASDRTNKDIKKLNNSSLFKGKNLNKNPILKNQYDAMVEGMFNQHLIQASSDHTYNPKLGRAVVYQLDKQQGLMRATEVKQVEHSIDKNEYPDFLVEFDDNGFVTSISAKENTIVQTTMNVENFIEHYGKKGMKWGVRKHGGNKPKMSNDAKRADYAVKKLKKGGLKSLSNNEIRDLNKRLQLEQQLSNLTPKKNSKVKKGMEFTREVLNAGNTVNSAIAFANSPAGKMIKDGLAKK